MIHQILKQYVKEIKTTFFKDIEFICITVWQQRGERK